MFMSEDSQPIEGEIVKPGEAGGATPNLPAQTLPATIHILPLTEKPFFPAQTLPLIMNEGPWMETVKRIGDSGHHLVGLVCVHGDNSDDARPEDFYRIGTLVRMHHPMRSDGKIQFIAEGISRFRVAEWISGNAPYYARVGEPAGQTDCSGSGGLRGGRLAVAAEQSDGEPDQARGEHQARGRRFRYRSDCSCHRHIVQAQVARPTRLPTVEAELEEIAGRAGGGGEIEGLRHRGGAHRERRAGGETQPVTEQLNPADLRSGAAAGRVPMEGRDGEFVTRVGTKREGDVLGGILCGRLGPARTRKGIRLADGSDIRPGERGHRQMIRRGGGRIARRIGSREGVGEQDLGVHGERGDANERDEQGLHTHSNVVG